MFYEAKWVGLDPAVPFVSRAWLLFFVSRAAGAGLGFKIPLRKLALNLVFGVKHSSKNSCVETGLMSYGGA